MMISSAISIDCVIDEIGIFARDELAHAFGKLRAADLRKQDQILQAFVNRGADTLRGSRVSRAKMFSYGRDVLNGARRKPKLD